MEVDQYCSSSFQLDLEAFEHGNHAHLFHQSVEDALFL
jgi:hypothetical protein